MGNDVEPYVRKGEKKKKKPKVRWFYGGFYFETARVSQTASTQTFWGTVKPNISNAKPDDGETLLNVRT